MMNLDMFMISTYLFDMSIDLTFIDMTRQKQAKRSRLQ